MHVELAVIVSQGSSDLVGPSSHPESHTQPWLGRREWSSPVIPSTAPRQLLVFWALCLAALAATSVGVFVARDIIVARDFRPLIRLPRRAP